MPIQKTGGLRNMSSTNLASTETDATKALKLQLREAMQYKRQSFALQESMELLQQRHASREAMLLADVEERREYARSVEAARDLQKRQCEQLTKDLEQLTAARDAHVDHVEGDARALRKVSLEWRQRAETTRNELLAEQVRRKSDEQLTATREAELMAHVAKLQEYCQRQEEALLGAQSSVKEMEERVAVKDSMLHEQEQELGEKEERLVLLARAMGEVQGTNVYVKEHFEGAMNSYNLAIKASPQPRPDPPSPLRVETTPDP